MPDPTPHAVEPLDRLWDAIIDYGRAKVGDGACYEQGQSSNRGGEVWRDEVEPLLRALRAEVAALREALRALAVRHDWQPGLGRCVCKEHEAVRRILDDGGPDGD